MSYLHGRVELALHAGDREELVLVNFRPDHPVDCDSRTTVKGRLSAPSGARIRG